MAAMYEAGIIGGALAYLLLDNHSTMVGCSAGCFALIGIRLGDLIMNWSERPYRRWRAAFLILLTVLIIIVEQQGNVPGSDEDAVAMDGSAAGLGSSSPAHLGGGLTGLLMGILL